MEIPIPAALRDFARHAFGYTVPTRRTAGFREVAGQKRGDGDESDMLANLVVWDFLSRRKIAASINIVSGRGDTHDLTLWVGGREKWTNIKTSSYFPYHDGLNLIVKAEEEAKPIDAYLQVFVHLKEPGTRPHVHLAGFCWTDGDVFRDPAHRRPIPRTDHPGIVIPVTKLDPIGLLVYEADRGLHDCA